MKIEHLALWVEEPGIDEELFERYFGAKPNHKYRNSLTHFESYFLSFEGGSRIELMRRPDVRATSARSSVP